MFNTSRDILNWVLSVSILGLAAFLCWGLYYIVATFRSIFKMIAEIEATVEKVNNLITLVGDKIEEGGKIITGAGEKVNDLFENIKDKLNHSSSYLMIIGKVLEKIFDFMQERKETKRSAKSKEL